MTTNDSPIVRESGFHASLLLPEFNTQFTQDLSNILIETCHKCAHTHTQKKSENSLNAFLHMVVKRRPKVTDLPRSLLGMERWLSS